MLELVLVYKIIVLSCVLLFFTCAGCRNDSFEVLEGPVVQINGSSLSGLHEEPVVIGSISDRTLDEGERGEKMLEEVFTELQDVDRDSSDYERVCNTSIV